jgi:hypothetical protein
MDGAWAPMHRQLFPRSQDSRAVAEAVLVRDINIAYLNSTAEQ